MRSLALALTERCCYNNKTYPACRILVPGRQLGGVDAERVVLKLCLAALALRGDVVVEVPSALVSVDNLRIN